MCSFFLAAIVVNTAAKHKAVLAGYQITLMDSYSNKEKKKKKEKRLKKDKLLLVSYHINCKPLHYPVTQTLTVFPAAATMLAT